MWAVHECTEQFKKYQIHVQRLYTHTRGRTELCVYIIMYGVTNDAQRVGDVSLSPWKHHTRCCKLMASLLVSLRACSLRGAAGHVAAGRAH